MSTESLSSIVLDVVANNRQIAKSIVGACRRSAARISDSPLSRLLGQRGARLDDLLSRGIGKTSDGAHYVLDRLYDRVSDVVTKTGSAVDEVGSQYSPACLNLARQAALPGARMARAISATLATRAGKSIGAGTAKSARKASARTTRTTRTTRTSIKARKAGAKTVRKAA